LQVLVLFVSSHSALRVSARSVSQTEDRFR
jgi:hypothetical protein